MDTSLLFESVYRGDVGMIQGGEYASFTLEPGETILVPREFIGKDLDGNVTFQLGVSSAVDHAHAAGPNLLYDLVVAEYGA